jgi:hypothetical protein
MTASDVIDLLDEGRIFGAIKRANVMGCELVVVPDSLDGSRRQARSFSYGAVRLVGDVGRRFGTGLRHDLGDYGLRRGRPAWPATSVAQEACDAAVGPVTPSPSNLGAAHLARRAATLHRHAVSAETYEPRALNLLRQPASIVHDRHQVHAAPPSYNHIDSLENMAAELHDSDAVGIS